MGNEAAAPMSRTNLNTWSRTLAPMLVTSVVLVMLVSGLGMVFASGAFAPATSHVALPTAHQASKAVSAAAGGHSSVAPASSAPATFTAAQRAAIMAQETAASNAAHVPTKAYLPPNYMQNGVSRAGNVLTATPAADTNPVGLSTLGIDDSSGTPVGKVFNSTSWMGSLTVNSAKPFQVSTDGPDFFGAQLNTVLSNVTVFNNSGAGVYWTQDVIEYSPSLQLLYIVDNVWNFSAVNAAEPASTFYSTGNMPGQNGFNGTATGSYYYDFFALPIALPVPFTVDLWTNASLVPYTGMYGNTNWNSAVTFGIEIPGVYASNYDRVQFNSTANATALPSPQFQVSGKYCTPAFPSPYCLPYDAEMILGGPGGGSSINFYGFNGTMTLSYIPIGGSAYTYAPYALNTGWDTGETAVGIAEHWTTAGTAYVEGGPSIPAPFWGSSPTGSRGTLTLTGTVSPVQAWMFAQAGSSITTDGARWAPAMPLASPYSYSWNLPPGTYTGSALYSNYDPMPLTWTGANGATVTLNVALTPDMNMGVYTPLVAWTNAQLQSQMYTGTHTVWNNQVSGTLSPYFLQMNDYLFQTFPGVLFVKTTVPANLNNSAMFGVDFTQSRFWSDQLVNYSITATSNDLNIDLYATTGVSIWHSTLGGWVAPFQQGFAYASVVLWDATGSVIGANVFNDMSTGLLIFNDSFTVGGGNTVWGNTFSSTPEPYAMSPLAIAAYEGNDAIWNNNFGTMPEASAPGYNFWFGPNYWLCGTPVGSQLCVGGQTNNESWNLTGAAPVPSGTAFTVGEFTLTGSVVGAPVVCGNVWIGDAPGSQANIPYNAEGNIWAGGDYCPMNPVGALTYTVQFVEVGLPAGTSWGVTLMSSSTGMTASTSGTTADLYIAGAFPDYYHWTAMDEAGFVAVPHDGQMPVVASTTVTINYVAAAISFTSPLVDQAYQGPQYDVWANWTASGLGSFGSQISLDLDIANSAGTVVSAKTANFASSAVSDFLPALSYPAGCYNIEIGLYNSSTPGQGEPSGPIATWADNFAQPFCVATAYTAVATTGSTSSIAGGNVTVYYTWADPASAVAYLTIWDVATASQVYNASVWESSGSSSGWVTFYTAPSTATQYAAEVETTNGAAPTTGHAATTVLFNSTFTVLPIPPPAVTTVPEPVWFNSTTTTNWYYNTTSQYSTPGGLAPNVLGTILLEIGIIVGAVVGIITGMMFARKPKMGSGGDMGGSMDTTTGSGPSDSSAGRS